MSDSDPRNAAQAAQMRRALLEGLGPSARFSEVVREILALLRDEAPTPADLDAVLQRDPALATKMLAVARSPFYGLRDVSSLHHAVTVLGFGGLRGLVVAAGVWDHLSGALAWYGHPAHGLADHSVAVAAAARSLAKSIGLDAVSRERVFVAGLLHDVGKVALEPQLARCGVSPGAGDARVAEQGTLGFGHAEVGADLCRMWAIERAVSDLVTLHHRGNTTDEPALAPVLRLGNALAHELEVGFEPGRSPRPVYAGGDLARVGLDGDRWELARSVALEVVPLAVAGFAALSR